MRASFDSLWRKSEGRVENRLRLRIDPKPHSCARVRNELLAYIGRQGLTCTDVEDFMFAVGEAFANAIEHSYAKEPISIDCWIENRTVLAEITDAGRGFQQLPPKKPQLPSLFSERGRGLAIIAHCTDSFKIESQPGGGTKVSLGIALAQVEDESKLA